MDMSFRLENIAAMVDSCRCMADVGTDHGYIPIYLVKNKIVERAIASDVNKGPVMKAKRNVALEGVEHQVECRLGGGLGVLQPHEADGVVIAGMGGNLIRDIIEDDLDVFKALDFAVLQPVQNPEVLRKHLVENNYVIIDEELCIDEDIFYEIIKVKHREGHVNEKADEIYYEVSKVLWEKKHPLINEFIGRKIAKYEKVLLNIKENSHSAMSRKSEVQQKISKLKELMV